MVENKLCPSYWAVIPANIRYDESLTPNAKLLYAEISSLTQKVGYCYASNQYFADLYKLSVRSIQRLLSMLSAKQYIAIEEYRNELSNEVIGRRIYAGLNPAANACAPPDKNVMTSRQKCHDPPDKNVMYININNNNTPLYPPKGGNGDEQPPRAVPKHNPERFEKFWSWYKAIPGEHGKARNENRRRAVKAWDTLRPDDSLIDLIAKALVKQLNTAQWQKGIGIPQAATYLNQRRWEDAEDLPEPGTQTGRPSSGGWADDEEVMG